MDILRHRWRYSSYSLKTGKKQQRLRQYTGYDDVPVRFVVGYNTYSMSYYNAFFRVDDVTTTVLEADETFASETQTIDSLDFKASESVSFFATNKFKPSAEGLQVEYCRPSINVPGNENDEDKTNQRVVVLKVKYVILQMTLKGQIRMDSGSVPGTSDWAVRSIKASSGSNSMDSGYRIIGFLQILVSPCVRFRIAS